MMAFTFVHISKRRTPFSHTLDHIFGGNNCNCCNRMFNKVK